MKRFSNEEQRTAEKRVKYNTEDLWGDSDSEIDDCLIRATQICEEQLPVRDSKKESNPRTNQQCDQSFLSSYNNVFSKSGMVASTQLETMVDMSVWPQAPVAQPSTSIFAHSITNGNRHNNGDNMYNQLKQLKEQLEAKDGEVTILRSQLKQTKEQVEQENIRRTNETVQKLNRVQRERDKIDAELGFKNLEVANLKRKLANITRNLFDSTLNEQYAEQTRSVLAVNDTVNLNRLENDELEHVIVPIAGTKYPLKSVIPTNIFESNADDCFPQCGRAKHTTDERYLHSLMFPKRQGWHSKGIFTYVSHRETLKLKHVFPAIRHLKDATENEVEHDTMSINQIYILTHILLKNQLQHLAILAKKVQKDEIRECDLVNLNHRNWKVNFHVSLFAPTSCCGDNSDECAIQCRQGISLLAAAFPYNKYLQQILTNNKTLQISECERKIWPYPLASAELLGEINFLRTLLKITILIGQIRKSHVYTGLLSSICYLLSQIIQIEIHKNTIYELIGNLTKELVLTIPTYPVLYHLSELFKHGANCKPFVEQLCSMPQRCHVQRKPKKSIMLVNNKCCTFEVYSTLCREAVTYDSLNNGGDFRIHLNLLQFVSNAIGCNVKWLHFIQDNIHFGCQTECYKLTIDVIYATLTKFRILQSLEQTISEEIIAIIKLSPSLLSTTNCKFGDLIEVNNIQYNLILKTCQTILKELRFDDWSEFQAESMTKQQRQESPPPVALNWDALGLQTLKIS